ncbi:RdgB/HAM1 family non-canonical purine NTP pyrophosphatase [Opitutus sp. GAS368]|uniref:RdgB/HAM1 family non-canonical purine NTP pyrophosphatase n=1 Tax=Opitutus sp. GAS368 TaxID=1882749 RepID=UPI00087D18C9|nr:RdgB/HAM1 family non-canonical purine NTP pyrophosphatase [Opitutus sp. GAS368]SDS54922.1 XTP/dITP diphosphohydrolase [Opitutus sp. GAS368]
MNLIHLATGNAHKAREMQALADASGLPVKIVAAATMPAVVEDTGTFAGNARKKAAALKAALPPGAWVLADDSGLGVEALDGAPGVESAYYAGPAGDSAANLAKLVEVMRPVPDDKRAARFVCVLVLLTPAGGEQRFEGRCDGTLRREPAGGGGFGYDPIFVPDGFNRTFAEFAEAEKNKISHRARAFAALARWLKENSPVQGSGV